MPGKDLLLYFEIPFCGLTFLMKCSSCRHENRVSCGAEFGGDRQILRRMWSPSGAWDPEQRPHHRHKDHGQIPLTPPPQCS
jgi:hypothetical protein